MWLDTWLYEVTTPKEQLPIALMGDFVSQLQDACGQSEASGDAHSEGASGRKIDKKEALAAVANLLEIFTESRTGLGSLASILKTFTKYGIQGTLQEGSGDGADQEGEDVQQALANPTRQLRDAMQQVVDSVTKPDGGEELQNRIVVFVDDLDRLRPREAVTVLEVIKNLLDMEGCVFVLALDFGVVERGILAKYPKMEEDKARRFFDKIIQVPFALPVSTYTLGSYVQGFLAKRGSSEDPDIYVRLINDILGDRNPREIKRAFNLCSLYEGLLAVNGLQPEAEEGYDRYALFALQLIHMQEMSGGRRLGDIGRKDSAAAQSKQTSEETGTE